MRALDSFDIARLQVQRTARVVTFGERTASVQQIWIACHGYGQLALGFAAQLSALQGGNRFVCVPEALNRFYLDDHGGQHGPQHPIGATWMTREERAAEIDDYCAYLDAVYDTARAGFAHQPTVIALGFSQGAATISRWAARTARAIDHVVLWGSGLAADLEPEPRLFGTASLTIVAGRRDRNVSAHAIAQEQQRLDDAGLIHTFEQFDGGHRMDDDTLLKLAARFS